MNGQEFYAQIDKHRHLDWLGVTEDFEDLGDVVFVGDSSRHITHAVAIRAIRDNSWEDFEALFAGRREARILLQLSRIVGYFSRINNWNFSKIAELHDRQKGDYTCPEQPKRKKVMVPGTVGRKSVGAESGIRTRTPTRGTAF